MIIIVRIELADHDAPFSQHGCTRLCVVDNC